MTYKRKEDYFKNKRNRKSKQHDIRQDYIRLRTDKHCMMSNINFQRVFMMDNKWIEGIKIILNNGGIETHCCSYIENFKFKLINKRSW